MKSILILGTLFIALAGISPAHAQVDAMAVEEVLNRSHQPTAIVLQQAQKTLLAADFQRSGVTEIVLLHVSSAELQNYRVTWRFSKPIAGPNGDLSRDWGTEVQTIDVIVDIYQRNEKVEGAYVRSIEIRSERKPPKKDHGFSSTGG